MEKKQRTKLRCCICGRVVPVDKCGCLMYHAGSRSYPYNDPSKIKYWGCCAGSGSKGHH